MGRPRVIDDEEALDAATEVLAAKGMAGTSVDDVAEAAGVSRATMYRCLGSKDEIVRAVIARESRRLLEALEGLVAEAENPHELIRVIVTASADGVDRSPVLRRLNNEDRRDTLPFITVDGAPLVEVIVGYGLQLKDRIAFAVDDDALATALEEAARLFLAHLTTPRIAGGRLDSAELGDRIATMVEPLLRAR